MPKFFTFVLIVFFALPGFCQEETIKEPITPGGGHVIIRNNPDAVPNNAPDAVEPDAAQAGDPSAQPSDTQVPVNLTEDEMLVEEAQFERQKQLDSIQAVQNNTEPLTQPKNPLEEIKKLGHEQIDAAAMMDDKVLAILQDVLKQGTMGKLPEADVKNMIKEKVKGSFLERVFIRFPSLLSISSDILRDKDALSGMIGIMRRKQDLKTYGFIWLAIFICGLLTKRKLVKPKWRFWKRFRWKFTINTCFSALSFYIFYSYFSLEIQPTLNIFAKHWF